MMNKTKRKRKETVFTYCETERERSDGKLRDPSYQHLKPESK